MIKRKRDPRSCRHGRHIPIGLHDLLDFILIGSMCIRCGRIRNFLDGGVPTKWRKNPFRLKQRTIKGRTNKMRNK